MRFVPRVHARDALVCIVLVVAGAFYLYHSTRAAHQSAYRWRNDDGTETSATFAAAANSPLTNFAPNSNKRLRFGAANSGTESELLEQAKLALHGSETWVGSGVIDPVGGFAYFGLSIEPRIAKVRLSDFTEVDSLTVSNVSGLGGVAIDVPNGYLYVGTATAPAKIIKISLTTFTETARITLAEDYAGMAILDSPNGFAYFAVRSPVVGQAIVAKIDLALFAETGALPLLDENGDPDTRDVYSATFDPINHFGYFVTSTAGGTDWIIARVDLDTFTQTGAIQPLASGAVLKSAAIDPAAGYLYLGVQNTVPNKVIRVHLSDFFTVDTLNLPATADYDAVDEAVIDTAGGFIYFTTGQNPTNVIKIDLGSFTLTDLVALSTDTQGQQLSGGIFDPTTGFMYFGTITSPTHIIKFDTGSFTQTAELNLHSDESPYTSVIDAPNRIGYFGTCTSPGKIIKVDLATLTRLGEINLTAGEDCPQTAVIDTAGGFAYFGLATAPGRIVKIDLGTFTEVAALDFDPGVNNARTSVIDTAGGFAYFGTSTSPGNVVKISLASFAVVSTASLAPGENFLEVSVIDPVRGFAYFGTYTSPGRIIKIDLGTMLETSLTLGVGENFMASAVADADFGYFGTDTDPGIVAKIDFSSFSETGALTLGASESYLERAAVIDPENSFAYFGTATDPGQIVKIDLTNFSEDSTFVFDAGERYPNAPVIDVANGLAYYGVTSDDPTIATVSIAPRAAFRLEYGTKVTTCSAIGSWIQVPTVAGGEAFVMYDSGNFTDGAATTNNAGVPDGNVVFKSGVMKEGTSQTAAISLGERQFSELEYSIKATPDATVGGNYCFRLTDAGNDSAFTYDEYAEATVATVPPGGGGGGQSCSQQPAVTMVFPNGGNTFTVGSDVAVQWSVQGCDLQTAKLFLSIDGGVTYPTVIAESLVPTSGAYSWHVGTNAMGNADRLKIEITKQGTIVASDASDANFTVLQSGSAGTGTPPGTPYDPAAERAASPTVSADKRLGTSPNSACPTHARVKTADDHNVLTWADTAVYECGSDGKRYAFPNEKVYFSWFQDFNGIETISSATMSSIPFGGMITFRPGVRMVKIQSDPKVYAVARGEVLRWIPNEATAVFLYGSGWATLVADVDPGLFATYTVGEPVPAH